MKRHAILLAALLFSTTTAQVLAQSALHCLHDGMWLPVAEVKGTMPYCFTGDDLVKGSKEEMTLLPVEDFAEGFIDVKVLKNVREGVSNSDGILRFSRDKAWYLMKATLVSDIDIEDCYYALRFETYGTFSYYCRPIGALQAGKPKSVEIFMKVGYEMPQQLHIFSGMEEVRTTLVPTEYSYNYGKFTIASR